MADLVVGIRINADGSAATAEIVKTRDALNQVGQSSDTARRQLEQKNAALQLVSQQFSFAKTALLGYIGAQALLRGAREWIETADSLTLINARLKQASQSVAEFTGLQRGLYESAQRLGVSYSELGASTSRLEPAVRALGGGAKEAAKLAEIVIATARIQGATTAEAASSAQQFAQALGSGVLQGDELKSILENNQKLARVLAEGLGVSVGQLKKLGEEGKLTADVVANAALKSYSRIQADVAQIPETFAASLTRLKNASEQAVDLINRQYGVTAILAGATNELVKALDALRQSNQTGAKSAADNTAAIQSFAYGAAALIDVLRAGAQIIGLLFSSLQAAGVLILAAAQSIYGAVQIIVGALSFDKEKVTQGFQTIGNAAGAVSQKFAELIEQAKALWNMPLLTDALDKTKSMATATVAVAESQETLAAKSAAANERWREATRDLKTLSTIQAEYSEQLSKLNTAYAQRSAAAANAYKTDAAQAAAQATVDRQYGEAKLALDKKLAKSKDDLAQQNQVSFEKQIRLAEVVAEAQIKAAQFVSQQEKLALDESQNYLEFAQRAGIISEQEYLTRRADLREADSVREINELKTNLSIQQRLLDEARQKASIARGKEGIASAQINVADIDKKRLETANQLILAEQKLGNVQLANIRELLAADKARAAAITQLQRAQEDSLQHIQDQVAALEFETSLIGKSELAQRRLTEARRIDLQVQQLKVQLARLEADALTRADPLDSQRIANLRESISALETSKTRVDELIVKQDQLNQTTQVYAEFWRNLDDAAFEAFKTIVTGSGNAIDSLKKLGNYLKDQLLRYLYQITAQKFIVQVFGQFSGSSTGSTVGNLFGSLFGGSGGDSGGGSGIGSLLSSVGSLFTSSGSSGGLFGGLFGGGSGSGAQLAVDEFGAYSTATTAGGAAGGTAGSGAFGGFSSAGVYAIAAIAGSYIGNALSKNNNNRAATGGAVGAVGGAALGAQYGSSFGLIGTAVGAIIGAVVGALAADRGGPKNGGSYIGNYNGAGELTSVGTRDLFGVHTHDDSVKEIAGGISTTFFDVLKKLGGSVSSASFGIGFDSDPQGSAQNRIKALASVNGQSVFSEIDREVGRDMQRLPLEIGTSANRALLAALQAAFKDVQNPVADILRSVNATTATTEAVDALIKKAYELKLFMDVLKQTALVGFSYEILEKFQRQGETIEQTLTRLGTAVGGFKDTFTSDDDKRKNALAAFNQLATDLGVKLPATAEGFRDMVLGLNLADDAQRRIFSVLIDSKDAAKLYYDEQARLAQAQRQAADEFRNQFTSDDERRSQAVAEFTQLIGRLGVALPDTAEGFRDMVLGLDQTDAAQKSLYELFLNSKDAARAYYDEQAKLTQAQVQAAEQLSQANASIDATIQGIRSKNPSFDQVGYAKREVARIGDLYASSTNVDQRLRLGGQLSTAINNRFGLETDALKKQFDARRQANSQAQQQIMQAIEAEKNAKIESARAGAQAAQALAEALNRIKQDNDALKLGDASPLTNAQRLTEARRQYDGILTRARGGDLEAVGQYTGIRSQLLELGQTYYSSASAEYGDLFRQLLGDGEALAAAGGARIDYSAYEREAIDTATGTLQTSAELVRLQTEAAGLDAEFQAQYEALEQAAIAELEAIKEANERAAQEQQARLDALHREAVRQANDVAEIKGLLVEIIGKQTPPIVLDDDTIKAVVSGITAGVARAQEGIRG